MAINWQTRTCDTLADLRAAGAGVPGVASQMHVLSYAAPGDGGEGFFTWDAASTGADDDAITIKPDVVSGAGRWVRINNTIVSGIEDAEVSAGDITNEYLNTNYNVGIGSTITFVNLIGDEGDLGIVLVAFKYDEDKWFVNITGHKL